jgi:DNA repair exonuclease SbcCD ATPase subunit
LTCSSVITYQILVILGFCVLILVGHLYILSRIHTLDEKAAQPRGQVNKKLEDQLKDAKKDLMETKGRQSGSKAIEAKLEKYMQGFKKAKDLVGTLKEKYQILSAENSELQATLALKFTEYEREASALHEEVGQLLSVKFELECRVEALEKELDMSQSASINNFKVCTVSWFNSLNPFILATPLRL